MLPELAIIRESSDLLLARLKGEWKADRILPPASTLADHLRMAASPCRIGFDTTGLKAWDSGLLTFVIKIKRLASAAGLAVVTTGLPEGAQRLLALAEAVPERKDAGKPLAAPSFLERVADSAISFGHGAAEFCAFLGETCVALVRLLVGRATFRRSDLLLTIQDCGPRALGIVSLISFLVGLILAFIAAIQLKLFGAQIYVANMVGIGMVRALAAIMTGVIMAGRTGSSFAAQLGAMQVNEEIDALKTLGISPMELLVLPRLIGMALMMPLLDLYANVVGMLGGFLIGVTMLDIPPVTYFLQTKASVRPKDFAVGLFSAAVFGVLVALAGCMRGLQCGRSASAVGEAATSAVVTSIVSIVVAMALITVVCNALHI